MTVENVVADLAALTVPTPITRENVDHLLDTRQFEVHMKNGNWWECRRNGKTRLWKRNPMRIYIPIKFGFKLCGTITEDDFDTPLQPSDPILVAGGKLNPLYFRIKPPAGVRK